MKIETWLDDIINYFSHEKWDYSVKNSGKDAGDKNHDQFPFIFKKISFKISAFL